MNRALLAALFGCLLFVSLGTVAAAPSGSAFAQQDIDPDDILMSIEIEDDGDGVWEIEYRTRLETDEDEEAFDDLRADVEADPEPYAERFQDRMDATAEGATDATGREMTITDMTVSVEKRDLPREYGVLTYRFRWSNFAAVEGDRLLVGDAIDALFLDDETALLISWSESYELNSVSPEPTETRDRAVVYNGPIDFGSGNPRIELASPGTAAPADGADRGFPAFSTAVIALGAALVGIAGIAFVLLKRRDEAATDGDVEAEEGRTQATDTEVASEPDEELLSNEEQVLRLIESEGGRMKQKSVAERLGWTDAKTSQVTKRLRENDELEGFRLGRENVLSLPENGSGEE